MGWLQHVANPAADALLSSIRVEKEKKGHLILLGQLLTYQI